MSAGERKLPALLLREASSVPTAPLPPSRFRHQGGGAAPLLSRGTLLAMVTRRTKPKAHAPRDPAKPGGKLEAFAKRVGGYGYSLTPHALFRVREKLGLEKLDLLVLLAVLSHAGEQFTDFACASFEVLAKDTGLDRKTVITHVNRLRDELTLLTWTNHRKPDKSLTPNIYNVQPLAEKLKALAATAARDVPEEQVDLDAIVAELMAEPGVGADVDDPGGEEAPAPRMRLGGWATIEKDDDDEPRVDRAATSLRTRMTTASTTPRSPSPPATREPAPSSPWASGSRLRPPELDEPDRAQLERAERLRHPDGRELTVDEHLYRMRELECFARDAMAGLLMDLGFSGEDITAAMNADPVERLRRLSREVAPKTAEPAPVTTTISSESDDPVESDALKAIEWAQRYRRERETK